MIVSVTLDKIVLEYVNVPQTFLGVLEGKGEISNINSIEGFHYHRCLQIRKKSGAYIKLYYQSKYEVWKPVGKLRLETHPKFLGDFKSVLIDLKEISRDIFFISTDVAFDVPIPLNNVFVTSNTGRQMNIFQSTRYFGGKGQRGKHGYCRIYDKKQELLGKGAVMDELTRVEIVYKPSKRMEFEKLFRNPPTFNKLYTGTIIRSKEQIAPKYKAMLICLQNGDITINEFSRHYRRVLKKQLNHQETINFDQLIENEWNEQVSKIHSFLL